MQRTGIKEGSYVSDNDVLITKYVRANGEYMDDSVDIKEIEKLLAQWFPDKSIRKFFLDITSDVYVGGNFEKIVAIWSGDGDNGKSVLQNVLEQMLGEYAKTLPTSLIFIQ